MTGVTGIGSWPGTDVREALRTVRDLLVDAGSGEGWSAVAGQPRHGRGGVTAIPHLPELPARGPGADMVGRTAGLLVEMPVDRQPAGWRLVDRRGKDAARTAALWRQDLDELAEAFDGWSGPLKLQAVGPWTLAATLELTRGERVVADPGATRDLRESLTEGLREHLRAVAGLVPGAELVLQLDEPALPAVLAGRVPTQSGYGTLRAVDHQEVGRGPAAVVDAVRGAAAAAGGVWVHCCHPDVPVDLLRRSGVDAIALDTTVLTPGAWEALAEPVEAGTTVVAGAVATTPPGDAAPGARWRESAEGLSARWAQLGLERRRLADVVVSPACGLAGTTAQAARAALRTCADAASALAETASS